MPTLLDDNDKAISAWAVMWALAVAIYGFCKLATWLDARGWRAPLWLSIAYLFCWPGMDARTFLAGPQANVLPPGVWQWLTAIGKAILGVCLVTAAASPVLTNHPWPRSWLGMAGVVFTLHFGVFNVLACLWRAFRIEAVPIMHCPVCSTSLMEFWSRRWNLAFRDLTHRFVFRPLAARVGAFSALVIGFVASGLIHDAVVSIPSGGGYGWPTLFFVIQAAGITVERSRMGKSLGLGRGLLGWIFAGVVLLAPAPLLFHEPFRYRVVLPFFDALWAFTGPT